jgi:hypothetical protein
VSLYVRLQSSFWTHRKTLRLRAAIGDAAFWIPPRLWSYAADNQPDGDFSDYSAEEIALLLGYPSNAQAMLKALQQARFLDGMKIHDWQEHNGYHSTFSNRARAAATARWLKERTKEKGIEKTRIERKGKEASIATSINPSTDAAYLADFSPKMRETFDAWISFRKGLGKKPKDWDAMFKKQVEWLKPFGEPMAIQILAQSIRNGWQGLFELKTNQNGLWTSAAERRQAEIDQANREYRERKERKRQEGKP